MPGDDVLVPDGGLSGTPEDRRQDLAADPWTEQPLRDHRAISPLYTGPNTWLVPPSRLPLATSRATTSWGAGCGSRANTSVT